MAYEEGIKVRFLEGLSVLELGDGVAGASATATLALLGAAVTTIVWPSALYRAGRPWIGDGHDAGPSVLAQTLEVDKNRLELSSASLAELEAAIAVWREAAHASSSAFAVVADRVAGAPYGIVDLVDADWYDRWVAATNQDAWVSISAFGLSGPRRHDWATELTLGAVSGMLSSARDTASGWPLKLAGQQSLLSAGQAAALAACHAVDLAADGSPVHLDLSAQEAAIATGPMLALAQSLMGAQGTTGANRYGAPAGFYRCRDGLIRISAMEDHQWQGVVRAMGSPRWADRFAATEARVAEPEEIDSRVGEWTKEISKAEAEACLQAQGVPATAMYSPAEILGSPQLEFRNALRPVAVAGGVEATVVGRPFRLAGGASQGPARRRSLRGLRVLEAGRVLAVPLAGALLGVVGADVTKLEDLSRIDMYRRRAPYIEGQPGINRAAYFAMVNHSKRNLVINLDEGTEDLKKALAGTDAVIENFGRRRADAFGLSAHALATSDRSVLGLSSSGYGYEGPSAPYRVYAYNLQTSCGLMYLTRDRSGRPALLDLPWADLICGYAIATIVAAWAIGPRGNPPVGIDFAMAELVTARFNEFVAAASLDPRSDLDVDRANDLTPFAPNGVYRTADGWVAVSVAGDESFRRVADELGWPASLVEARFATVALRLEARAEMDDTLGKELAVLATDEVVERLRAAGAICEALLPPADLPADPHLRERGFFATVDHPEWGRRQVIGVPWRPAGGPAIALTAPPTMASGEAALSAAD